MLAILKDTIHNGHQLIALKHWQNVMNEILSQGNLFP